MQNSEFFIAKQFEQVQRIGSGIWQTLLKFVWRIWYTFVQHAHCKGQMLLQQSWHSRTSVLPISGGSGSNASVTLETQEILSLKSIVQYKSVWPSGLRRWLQVPFYFGRRGFEPLSGQMLQGLLFSCTHPCSQGSSLSFCSLDRDGTSLGANHHSFFSCNLFG